MTMFARFERGNTVPVDVFEGDRISINQKGHVMVWKARGEDEELVAVMNLKGGDSVRQFPPRISMRLEAR